MNYDVQLTETFQKSIKALKKKYPHVKDDLLANVKALEEDPFAGDPIPGWNKEIWKVRVASSDVKKGKRGGYRVAHATSGEVALENIHLYHRRRSELTMRELCCSPQG